MIWLLGGYMWLFIHRPFEVWPWLGDLRIERVYMLFVLAAWMVTDKSWIPNPLNRAFLAFVGAILLSWQASPFRDSGSEAASHTVEIYLKVAVFFVLVMSTIRSEQALRQIVLMYLGATSLYMLHSLWELQNGRHVYRMGIQRMVGVDTTYGDPNTFAATILYSLPLALVFWREAATPWKLGALLGYSALSVTCILLTGSRSAFVGLIALAMLMCIRSPKRWRLLALLCVCLPLLWSVVPSTLQNRFWTLIDSSTGPANAQESADSRAEGWRDGVRIWRQYPVCGAGPGCFGLARGYDLQSHHLYGQVIGELGTGGAITFGWVILAFFVNAWQAWQIARASPELRDTLPYHLSQAVIVVVMLLLVMGFGGHNLYRYTWMWFGAFQAIALYLLRGAVCCDWEDTYSVDDEVAQQSDSLRVGEMLGAPIG